VNFAFFAAAIGFSMFLMHPVSLGISLFCAVVYRLRLKAKHGWLLYVIPMAVFTGLLNPLFNHRGATILAYLPSGNPITLEAILHGVAVAVMLVAVVTWFSCFNEIVTSDKFIYLFGKITPALALVLSMVLRLAPRFLVQIKVIANAQKCIGRDISQGSVVERARHGVRILSIMVTWVLENSTETAVSMRCRGYGLPGRTAFTVFRFEKRDGWALGFIFACVAGVFTGVEFFAYFVLLISPTVVTICSK